MTEPLAFTRRHFIAGLAAASVYHSVSSPFHLETLSSVAVEFLTDNRKFAGIPPWRDKPFPPVQRISPEEKERALAIFGLITEYGDSSLTAGAALKDLLHRTDVTVNILKGDAAQFAHAGLEESVNVPPNTISYSFLWQPPAWEHRKSEIFVVLSPDIFSDRVNVAISLGREVVGHIAYLWQRLGFSLLPAPEDDAVAKLDEFLKWVVDHARLPDNELQRLQQYRQLHTIPEHQDPGKSEKPTVAKLSILGPGSMIGFPGRRVDLKSMISQLADYQRPFAQKKKLQVFVGLPKQPLYIVDRGPIIGEGSLGPDVINELIYNAVKYTPLRGQIKISLRQVDHQAVFEISDSGIGISKEDLESGAIWKWHYRGEHAIASGEEGTGEGLALLKAIVAAYDGHIDAKSRGVGQGSVFVLRLPLAAEETHPSSSDMILGADGALFAGLRAIWRWLFPMRAPSALAGSFIPPIDTSAARMDVLELHRVDGKVEHRSLKEYLGPLHHDPNDFVLSDRQSEILQSAEEGKPQSIVIGLPTFQNAAHIGESLSRLIQPIREIRRIHPTWTVELVVGANGPDRQKTLDVVRHQQKEYAKLFIPMTVLDVPFTGKNQALNAIAELAERHGATIVSFIDDDIEFDRSALLGSVEDLLRRAREQGELSYVGSIPRYVAPTAWWGRITGRVRSSVKNIWPIGHHMTLFTGTYPMIPTYLLYDDTYLAAYFRDLSHPQSGHRIYMHPIPRVSVTAAQTLREDARQYRRHTYAAAQVRALMPEKSAVMHSERRKRILKRIFSKRITSVEDLKDYAATLVFSAHRAFWSVVIGTELRLRAWFNRPRRSITWGIAHGTKSFPSQEIHAFRHAA